ncbi:MAG: Crp/Fnr family transcriptional regulator [Verrucomicrobiae bacterium]|nr:Crp/Fnr family transcriptional regulator [Verrucomicrobiae bacterium]
MKINTTLLAAQPFLKGLSKQQLEVLSDNAMLVEFPVGRLIFEEGLDAHRFYVILEGSVALESANGSAESDLIQTISAGDVLGWSWLFPPYKWNFNARALAPTKAIIFFAPTLRELCERDHDLGYELLKRVSQVVISRLQSTRLQSLKRVLK